MKYNSLFKCSKHCEETKGQEDPRKDHITRKPIIFLTFPALTHSYFFFQMTINSNIVLCSALCGASTASLLTTSNSPYYPKGLPVAWALKNVVQFRLAQRDLV